MLQFVYRPEHAGLPQWPSGELRLEGIEITEDPNAADVFVCPGSLALFRNPADLYTLPFFRGRESQHVFFDVSDHETQYRQPSIFLRCNLRPFNLATDPCSIQLAWPVEDYADCMEVPAGGFLHEVSFQGWITSHESRQRSVDSCRASGLRCDFATYADFTGYIFDTTEGLRRRAEFRRSMRESKIALCPESISSVFPYRYYEALSAGRVPLLVGSDFVFPFHDEIDYSAFTIFCPRERAQEAGPIAADFLAKTSDDEIIEMGRKAREAWVKWLDSRLWPQLHAYAVRQHFAKRAVVA